MPALRDTEDRGTDAKKSFEKASRGQLERTEKDVSYTDARSTSRKVMDRIKGYGKDTGGLKVDWSDRASYENPKAYGERVERDSPENIKAGMTKNTTQSASPGIKPLTTAAAPKPLSGYAKSAADYNVTAPTIKVDPITGEVVKIDQQSIEQQQAALGLIEQAAQGNAPSAAGLQMKQGMQESIQSQMAMARSGRGGYNPAAMRQAQQAGVQQQQAVNQQMGILRAQEMATARGQYGDLASNIVAQRAQANQFQDNLTQGANIQNQNMSFNTQSQNAGNVLQAEQQTLQGKLGYSQLQEGIANRNATLTMAKNSLSQAKTDADRKYWMDVIGKISDVGSSAAASYIGG